MDMEHALITSSCSVCLNQYDEAKREPKFLQCHHTFCRQCIVVRKVKSKMGGRFVRCPLCSHVTQLHGAGVQDLTTNPYLLLIKHANQRRSLALSAGEVQKNWRMGYGAWPALSMLGKRTLYCPHRSWEDLQYIRLGPNSEHRPSKLASKKDSQRILLNNGLTIPRVADPVEIQMEWSEIRLKKVSIQLPDQEYSNERLKSKRSLETESDGSGFHVRMIHCDSENQPESPSSGLNN